MLWLGAILYNRDERRLRALWRLLIQEIGSLLLIIGGAVVCTIVIGNPGWSQTCGYILGALISLGTIVLAGRFLDRRPLSHFGFIGAPHWWTDLAFGLALGAVLISAIFLTEWLAGWLTIDRFGWASAQRWFKGDCVREIVLCIAVAWWEEPTCRGYQLRNLAEGLNFPRWGARPALVLAWLGSAVVFGIAHIHNPSASAYTTSSIVAAGLLLGLPRILTGSLAIPIGIHVTWNFFQGAVCGFSVSGSYLGDPLIQITQTGPSLWTGGAWGPEAGLLGIGAQLVGGLLILGWIRWTRGDLVVDLALTEGPPRPTPGPPVLSEMTPTPMTAPIPEKLQSSDST